MYGVYTCLNLLKAARHIGYSDYLRHVRMYDIYVPGTVVETFLFQHGSTWLIMILVLYTLEYETIVALMGNAFDSPYRHVYTVLYFSEMTPTIVKLSTSAHIIHTYS